MASVTKPASLAEEAMDLYLQQTCAAALNTVKVMRRFDDEEIEANRLSILCRRVAREQPEAQVSGGWVCEIELTLTTHSSDYNGTTHDEICGAVMDALMAADANGADLVAAAMNEVMDGKQFQAVSWWPPADMVNSVEGKRYKTEMAGALHMLPVAAA
jgi:hypothetical protein